MKRVIAVILTVIMAFSPICDTSAFIDVVKAEETVPVAPGESFDNATEIMVGTTYSVENMSLLHKLDYYVFNIAKPGIVNFEFQRTKSSGTMVVGFNAAESNVISDITFPSAMYMISASDATLKKGYDVGLPAGKYYLYVGNAKADGGYSIKINYTENNYCETEANDTNDTADDIEISKDYMGSLYSREANLEIPSDKDYYRVKTSEEGYINVEFTPENVKGAESTDIFTVNVYSSDAPDSALYTMRVTGEGKTVTSTNIGVEKEKYFYIRVTGQKKAVGCDYKLKVKQTKAKGWEKERNELPDSSTTISVNEQYNGIILNDSDVDFYQFTAPDTGHFNVSLSHKEAIKGYENRNTFKIAIYDDKAATNAVAYIDSIKGGVTSVNTAEMATKKGNVYYIKVSGNLYCQDIIYNLKVNFEGSNNWEVESNDTYASATPLKSGTKMYGSTSSDKDIDYYWIDLKKNGYIALDIEQKANVNANIYMLKIIDSTYKTMYETAINGLEPKYSMSKLGLKKGKYYICISCRYKADLYSGTYGITAKAVTSDSWETENNDDFSTADAIKVGKKIHGVTMGDESNSALADPYDYYKFTLDKGTYVNLSMTHSKINGSETMWYVCMYEGAGKTVKNSGMYVKEASKYSETKTIYLKKGSYYVRVAASDSASAKAYTLTVNKISAKKPKLESIALKKGAVKLSWSIVPGAKKYEIYRCTSKKGKYKKIKTINSVEINNWTDKKVKKGKKYFYKIRVKVTTKSTKTSKFSSVRSIKVK